MRKIFAVAALFISSQTGAQTIEEDSSKTLDKIVITATKFPTKQSNTGKLVSVVTREQIEKSAGKDLAQVLNEQTGLTVNGSYSNPGKDKSVFFRGASSNYTLILLDGVPLNDPSGNGGTFDIRLIPLEQIERLEILKGSQSTLYGSNAIAGVINIISKKPSGSELTGSGLLSYGSYNSFKGNANVSRKTKALEYNFVYEYFDTEGITEAKDATGTNNFDKDGFNRQSLQANLGINVNSNIKISPYYRFSEFKGEYDADAFTDGPNKYNASLVNTGLIGTLKYTRGIVTANYGYDFTNLSYTGYLLGGTEMMRVANMNSLEVRVDVGENDIVKVSIGDSADVEVDAYNNRKFKGIVTQIASSTIKSGGSTTTVSNDVTNYEVHIRLAPSSYQDLLDPSQPKKFPFRPGMNASADIKTNIKTGVIAIPITAVAARDVNDENGDKKKEKKPENEDEDVVAADELKEVVFVLNKEKKVEMRTVKTGIQDINNIEILSGLKEGDEVVTAPYNAVTKTLKSGTKVKAVSKDKLFEK